MTCTDPQCPPFVDYTGAEIHAECTRDDHVSGIANCTSRAMRDAATARHLARHGHLPH